MGNLDKLRAANAAAMEKKAQNKKISDSLVDEIIKEGISFEFASFSSIFINFILGEFDNPETILTI